jgi:two-component system, LytTR family, sensor kinase
MLGWLAFLGTISVQHTLSGAFAWHEAIQITLYQWLPWTLLLPFILWLTARFPLERHGWWQRLLLHLGAGIISVMICVLAGRYVFPPPPPPWAGPRPEGGEEHQHPGPRLRGPGPGPGSPGGDLWFGVRLNVPIYLVFASLGHAITYFRRARQRERRALELEAHLAQARLQALRMQLHPHFLFNTLNAISTLVHTNPRAADEMIGSLSDMLRLSLDSATEAEVPLQRELDFLNHYLDIEKTRFGDRLRVQLEIAPEVNTALVPTLILQPLVENAIRHGLEPKLSPGTMRISAQRAGDKLRLAIHDSGVGLSSAAGREGIGLSNTRARLAALYPGQHQFTIQNAPAGGCTVELEIPYHTATLPATNPEKSP